MNNFKIEIKMDEKFNEATKQRPQGERTMDAPLVTIHLRFFKNRLEMRRHGRIYIIYNQRTIC